MKCKWNNIFILEVSYHALPRCFISCITWLILHTVIHKPSRFSSFPLSSAMFIWILSLSKSLLIFSFLLNKLMTIFICSPSSKSFIDTSFNQWFKEMKLGRQLNQIVFLDEQRKWEWLTNIIKIYWIAWEVCTSSDVELINGSMIGNFRNTWTQFPIITSLHKAANWLWRSINCLQRIMLNIIVF